MLRPLAATVAAIACIAAPAADACLCAIGQTRRRSKPVARAHVRRPT
ncbi:hypothetical protein [uncultured Sphingomonas sp.]|nr:hypothetical protein [uncultured Sphingomonas sp.]